jgi:extradiol dioxygenase family protein
VLGLAKLPRPDFGFPGLWYSLKGDAQLHIILNADWPFPTVDRSRLEVRSPHFALAVDDADHLAARLEAAGEAFHDFTSTPTGLRQLFLYDPDGNMVELIGPTRARRELRLEQVAAATA